MLVRNFYKAAWLEKKKHIGERTLDTTVCMLMEKKLKLFESILEVNF